MAERLRCAFDDFEVDFRAGELRRRGKTVKLQEKPFHVLKALLERPGELVTREELRQSLWAESTFVEFNDNINTAVRKLRLALDDSSEHPRFIETIPRKGYRFTASVTWDSPEGHRPSSYRSAMVVSAGLVLVGLVLSRASHVDPPSPRIETTTRLTSRPGLEHQPAWSPDGSAIAFASDGDGNENVYRLLVGELDAQCLTCDHPGYDGAPAWSPDGASIAFASDRQGGGIFTVPANGGAASRLVGIPFVPSVERPGSVPQPSWSPDGQWLAYAFGLGADRGLFRVPARGGDSSPISISTERSGFSTAQAAWSPDGGRIAFAEFSGAGSTHSRLFTVDLATGTAIPLSEALHQDEDPQWSPDGMHLLFVSDRSGSSDLWWLDLDRAGRPAGAPHQLTVGAGIDSAAVAPDGKRIAYTRGIEKSNLYRLEREALEALTTDDAVVENVDVSSDGEWLVFDSDRSGKTEIWVMRTDGTELRQVTRHADDNWFPSFSPDAREIVYHSLRDGQRDLFAIRVDGGPERRLTDHPAQDWTARWSPDGRYVAFGSDRSGNPDIWVVARDGGEARQLTDERANDHNPMWAPDADRIVFASDRSGSQEIYVLPLAGGEPRRLTHQGWLDVIPFAWPKGKDVLYAWGKTEEPRVAFFEVSTLDGAARPIFETRPDDRRRISAALAADGRALFFPLWERVGDLWLAELSER